MYFPSPSPSPSTPRSDGTPKVIPASNLRSARKSDESALASYWRDAGEENANRLLDHTRRFISKYVNAHPGSIPVFSVPSDLLDDQIRMYWYEALDPENTGIREPSTAEVRAIAAKARQTAPDYAATPVSAGSELFTTSQSQFSKQSSPFMSSRSRLGTTANPTPMSAAAIAMTPTAAGYTPRSQGAYTERFDADTPSAPRAPPASPSVSATRRFLTTAAARSAAPSPLVASPARQASASPLVASPARQASSSSAELVATAQDDYYDQGGSLGAALGAFGGAAAAGADAINRGFGALGRGIGALGRGVGRGIGGGARAVGGLVAELAEANPLIISSGSTPEDEATVRTFSTSGWVAPSSRNEAALYSNNPWLKTAGTLLSRDIALFGDFVAAFGTEALIVIDAMDVVAREGGVKSSDGVSIEGFPWSEFMQLARGTFNLDSALALNVSFRAPIRSIQSSPDAAALSFMLSYPDMGGNSYEDILLLFSYYNSPTLPDSLPRLVSPQVFAQKVKDITENLQQASREYAENYSRIMSDVPFLASLV